MPAVFALIAVSVVTAGAPFLARFVADLLVNRIGHKDPG